MDILFIHQNFPGQFKHLAPALAQQGHRCVALTLRVKEPTNWQGVRVLPYKVPRGNGNGTHPWVADLETKVIRAEACYHAAQDLRKRGFDPQIVIAHPGWGESMFLRDVWPQARIGLYYELYHTESGGDLGFDPEFSTNRMTDPMRLRMKNLNNTLHLPLGDMGLSPTHFQANTFPPAFRERIHVIHDGIDTDFVKPDSTASFTVKDGPTFGRDDEVVTFVNRNLEPYRGYHVFMRALPDLLASRPNAHLLVVGGDEVSYGARPSGDTTWKQIFIDEVREKISDADWARVHFLGRIPYDQFLKMLQVSRAHIYLTYPFVLSWSLFETMATEGAIVASNTAPVVEAIKHEDTGLLVDFFDRDALVAETNRLLDDEDLRRTLGSAARKHIVDNYDLRSVCLPKQLEWVSKLTAMTAGGTSPT